MKIINSLVLAALLSSCTAPTPTQSAPPTAVAPLEIAQPLLELPANKMLSTCSTWNNLSLQEREHVWQEIFMQMVAIESNFNGKTMYRESKIPGKDALTGVGIYSEGYFQLSYQDKLWYGEACEFDFEVDKVKFMHDTLDGRRTGSFLAATDRKIQDFRGGWRCANAIAVKLTMRSGGVIDNLAKYWSSARKIKGPKCN